MRTAGFLAPGLHGACRAKHLEDAAKGPDRVPDAEGEPSTWKGGIPPRTHTLVRRNLRAGWRSDDLRTPEGWTLRQWSKPLGPPPG